MTVFGTTSKGQPVEAVTLGAGDLTVTVLTWGAVIQSVRLKGVDHDLTLGSDNLADYEGAMRYHGALIGPVANRVSGGRIKIGQMMYELERNQNGKHLLHSGKQATYLQVWQLVDHGPSHATLSIDLPDGMCGLPGNRRLVARYEVEAPATLRMSVTAETDEPTVMNLANHSYWNLDGTECWDGHTLRLAADAYLPVTDEFCPTGDVVEVDDTPMDLRAGRSITARTDEFDNCFCLSDERLPLRDVVWLTGTSGVSMTMATTEPGMHVYDGRHAIRPGHAAYEGIALEAEFWPDATNNAHFPSILLRPGEHWEQVTEWRFSR